MMLPIERQHEELWDLAQNSQGQIIPFYAADPRHKDIVERVKNDAMHRPEGLNG